MYLLLQCGFFRCKKAEDVQKHKAKVEKKKHTKSNKKNYNYCDWENRATWWMNQKTYSTLWWTKPTCHYWYSITVCQDIMNTGLLKSFCSIMEMNQLGMVKEASDSWRTRFRLNLCYLCWIYYSFLIHHR